MNLNKILTIYGSQKHLEQYTENYIYAEFVSMDRQSIQVKNVVNYDLDNDPYHTRIIDLKYINNAFSFHHPLADTYRIDKNCIAIAAPASEALTKLRHKLNTSHQDNLIKDIIKNINEFDEQLYVWSAHGNYTGLFFPHKKFKGLHPI